MLWSKWRGRDTERERNRRRKKHSEGRGNSGIKRTREEGLA
jgi:hypothetical protein